MKRKTTTKSPKPSSRDSFFQWITSSLEIECEWLDMLSQMEYVGCRKIIKSVPFDKITSRELQHITEESLHALQLRRLVDRLSDRARWTGRGLAALAWDYFQALDREISQLVDGKYIPYAAVSWTIEQRVLELYPSYARETRIPDVKKVLQRILSQERRHADQFDAMDFAEAFKKKARQIEQRLWEQFLLDAVTYVRDESLIDSRIPRSPRGSAITLH